MGAMVMDECTYHLIKAQECLNMYEEIDSYSAIFEAEDPKVKAQQETNNKVTTGAFGHIRKAMQAILNTIKNLVASIGDFFRKRGMDDAERKAYDDFKAAAAKDPALKNKKITVLDFRKFNEEYQTLLAETEKAERELAKNKDYPLEALGKKVAEFCGNAGKGLVVSVGCEAALNVASSSRSMAKDLLASLQSDEKMWNTLCESVGEKEAKKFEKQLASLGKRCSLQHLKMRLKGTASKSVEDAFEKTLKSVEELCMGGALIGKNMPSNDPSKSSVGNAMNAAKALVSHPGDTISGAKKVAKNSDIVQRAMGNEQIKKGVQRAMDINSQSNKASREMWKNEHRPKKKLFKKKKDLRDQSTKDAILGKNDPNSLLNRVKNK